jgi:hypothetical protein
VLGPLANNDAEQGRWLQQAGFTMGSIYERGGRRYQFLWRDDAEKKSQKFRLCLATARVKDFSTSGYGKFLADVLAEAGVFPTPAHALHAIAGRLGITDGPCPNRKSAQAAKPQAAKPAPPKGPRLAPEARYRFLAWLAGVYADRGPPTWLARKLDVSPEVLAGMRAGTGTRNRDGLACAVAQFRMLDGEGRVVGTQSRFKDNHKRDETGNISKGLFYVPALFEKLPPGTRVPIPEGASDAAVFADMGIAAVGRASAYCSENVAQLAEFFRRHPHLVPIVVLENDSTWNEKKGVWEWPGRDGGFKIARELAGALGRPVLVAFTPEAEKDVRRWRDGRLAAGETDRPALGRLFVAKITAAAFPPPEPPPQAGGGDAPPPNSSFPAGPEKALGGDSDDSWQPAWRVERCPHCKVLWLSLKPGVPDGAFGDHDKIIRVDCKSQRCPHCGYHVRRRWAGHGAELFSAVAENAPGPDGGPVYDFVVTPGEYRTVQKRLERRMRDAVRFAAGQAAEPYGDCADAVEGAALAAVAWRRKLRACYRARDRLGRARGKAARAARELEGAEDGERRHYLQRLTQADQALAKARDAYKKAGQTALRARRALDAALARVPRDAAAAVARVVAAYKGAFWLKVPRADGNVRMFSTVPPVAGRDEPLWYRPAVRLSGEAAAAAYAQAVRDTPLSAKGRFGSSRNISPEWGPWKDLPKRYDYNGQLTADLDDVVRVFRQHGRPVLTEEDIRLALDPEAGEREERRFEARVRSYMRRSHLCRDDAEAEVIREDEECERRRPREPGVSGYIILPRRDGFDNAGLLAPLLIEPGGGRDPDPAGQPEEFCFEEDG